MNWKVLSAEEIINNRWVGVQKEKVELPNGEIIDEFYKIRVCSASAVIALTEENEIILKNEYRHCYERELIELPSGVFEENETDPLKVAQRELLEETGYESDDWTYLGPTIENAAKLTNTIHLYLAKGCRKVSKQHLDKTESIDVMKMRLQDAVNMVMKGEIPCSTTAHGILRTTLINEGSVWRL